MKKVYEGFEVDWPSDYEPGNWVGVRSGWPDDIPHRFEIKLRRSPRGELVCAALRIGDDVTDKLYREPWPAAPDSNITSRMLARLPLGAVLKYIQEQGVSDPAVRARMERLSIGLALPLEVLSVVPGAKRKDDFYIHQAEVFARHFRQLAKDRTARERSRMAYEAVANETGWAKSTVYAQVKRGWQLRPDLKPRAIPDRKPKEKP